MHKNGHSAGLDHAAGHDNSELQAVANVNATLDASIEAVKEFAAKALESGRTFPTATIDAARDFLLKEVLDQVIENIVDSTEMDAKAKDGWKKGLEAIGDALRSLSPQGVAEKLVLEVIPAAAKVVLDTAEFTRNDLKKTFDMSAPASGHEATAEEAEAYRARVAGELSNLDADEARRR